MYERVMIYLKTHRRPLLILLVINSIYFFSYFQRIGIPGTIFNELQSSFLLSATAVAGLATLFLYLYGGMQIFAGLLADRVGPSRTILLGGLLLSIGSLLFPSADSVEMLYTARTITAIGASLIYISVVKTVDTLFEASLFPVFLSISLAIGYSGGLFATLPFERMVHAMGWRHALILIAIASLTVTLLSLRLLLGKTFSRSVPASPFSRESLLSVLNNKKTVPLITAGSITFAIYYLFQATLGKKFLEDFAGLPPFIASAFPFAMMLFVIPLMIIAGLFSRSLGKRRPLLLFSTITTLAGTLLILITLIFHLYNWFFLIAYILLAISSACSPIFSTAMKELNHPDTTATAIGLLNGASYLSVALLTTIAGAILDMFSRSALKTPTAIIYPGKAYATLFIVCLLLAIVAFLFSLRISEPIPRKPTKNNIIPG